MEVIHDLLDYVNEGTLCESLQSGADTIGSHRLRVVAIKVLGWLKSQHRMATKCALALNRSHTWCENLEVWMQLGSPLSECFEIGEDGFDFRAEVTQDERDDIRAMVDTHHQPRLMT